jgi:hypothetical protein
VMSSVVATYWCMVRYILASTVLSLTGASGLPVRS